MPIEASVTIQSQAVEAALRRVLLHLPLARKTQPLMAQLARVLKTGAQGRFRSQEGPDGQAWKPSRRAQEEGGQTLSMTGRLRRSLTTAATYNTATVGTNDIRAAIHHFGGVIRPKSGPFLSIPVTPQARQAGSPKRFPGPLRVAQTLRGQFILVDDKGTTQYLLRRQVTMPARPFLGASGADETALQASLDRYLQRAWSG
ncbi:MAG: phage virion morphogenesis protein [Burkholderiales bacterium]|nr:phage virion morphogenesis protein [Burkholderiales bacterium]